MILNELTGAASELNEAIMINPTDTEKMADDIATALAMPADEQKQRLKKMQAKLMDYDVVAWVNCFLEELQGVKKDQLKQQSKLLEKDTLHKIVNNYRNAKKRCILLDYNGTLLPFTIHPEEAVPDKQLLNFLKDLCADEKNKVVVISGRDAKTLEKWMGHLPINFVSEYGVYIKYKAGDWQTQTTISAASKNRIRPLLESFVSRCAGSFLEEKSFSLSWHYRNTHPGLGFIRSTELLNNLSLLISNSPVQVIDGNKVLEVRLTGLNKAITAQKGIEKFGIDFILYLGADTTDEDMFKALEHKGYTIKIGTGSTSAYYKIASQAEVLPFLEMLLEKPAKKNGFIANLF